MTDRSSALADPEWIFDIESHAMVWANAAGLGFWQADSVEALKQRDFNTDSAVVRMRLRTLRARCQQGEKVRETWTLYPRDTPVVATVDFEAAPREKGPAALQVRVVQTEPPSERTDARLVEMARTSKQMLLMYALSGELLGQNPAADACFGAHDPSASAPVLLSDRVLNSSVCAQILARTADDSEFTWEVNVQTRAGPRPHRITAQRGRDPVTGKFVAVLSHEDATEMTAVRSYKERQSFQLEKTVAEQAERLRESEERYRLAVASAHIWDWDLHNGSLFMSESFIELLGYTPAEFWARVDTGSIASFVHPDDRTSYLAELKRHIEEPDHTFVHEHRFVTKTGEAIWFRAQGQCGSDEDGKPTRSVGILTDITEQKTIQERLLTSQRLEAVGQLTGGIAHDFNNLLSVIQGNAELLAMSQTEELTYAEEIIQAVRRGARLTGDLLAFSRRQTLRPQHVGVLELLQRLQMSLLRPLGENISVSISVDADATGVWADPTMLEHAVINLALNARDAIDGDGSILIQCTRAQGGIALRAAEGSDVPPAFVELSVSDTGSGMEPATLAQAFEPFFSTKPVGKGTGLGLSMVMGFARQSGGDVDIQSAPGQGTRVSVYLPASEAAPEIKRRKRKNILPGHGEHIHLVEDNRAVRQVTETLLKSLGYTVSTSADGWEAEAFVDQGSAPDLFLLDIVLPGPSGVELARKVRTRLPNVPILLLSGYPRHHVAEAAPVDDIHMLKKPTNALDLSLAIRKALERHETRSHGTEGEKK